MKGTFVVLAVYVLFADVAALGQVGVKARTRADADLIAEEFRHKQAEFQRRVEKAVHVGAKLVGCKIPSLQTPPKVDAMGMLGTPFVVVQQVIGPEEMMVKWASVVYIVKGFDTSKLVDDADIIIDSPLKVARTKTYTTVAGGTNTVFELEPLTEEERKAIVKEAEDKLYRTWKDKTGNFTIEAKFLKFEAGKAHLERRDNKQVIQVSSGQLCDEDRNWIRDEVARLRKLEEAKNK